jgi:hypothetical protein
MNALRWQLVTGTIFVIGAVVQLSQVVARGRNPAPFTHIPAPYLLWNEAIALVGLAIGAAILIHAIRRRKPADRV